MGRDGSTVRPITHGHPKALHVWFCSSYPRVLESVQAEVLHCSARVICSKKNFQWLISTPVNSHSAPCNSLLGSSCSHVDVCCETQWPTRALEKLKQTSHEKKKNQLMALSVIFKSALSGVNVIFISQINVNPENGRRYIFCLSN